MNLSKIAILLIASSVVVFLVTGIFTGLLLYPSFFPKVEETENDPFITEEVVVNQENCIADDCLLVEDLEYPLEELPQPVATALEEALLDEYKARAVYGLVIDEFGAQRPFSMIIRSEEQHIASLKALYDKYGLIPPENPWTDFGIPASIADACQIGVDAEIANAALYKDELLPAVQDYPDIVSVFTTLMNASLEKHLPAFERCAN